MTSPEEKDRLIRELSKIRLICIVSFALAVAVIAYMYYVIRIHVAMDQGAIQSLQTVLTAWGINDPVFELTLVFCVYACVVVLVSYLLRRLILFVAGHKSAISFSDHLPDWVASRYGLSVFVSTLVVFLIPATGVVVLMCTAAHDAALLAVAAISGLGICLMVPRAGELRSAVEHWTNELSHYAPSNGIGSPQRSFQMHCTGMTLGYVRTPGGTVVVSQDELTVRTFFGILGEYRLKAQEVIKIHVESSHWLTGLKVRIEHVSREVPGQVVLGFDMESDLFLDQVAKAGFRPLAGLGEAPREQGLPVRPSVLILLVVVWNGLCLLGVLIHPAFLIAAVLVAFAVSSLFLRWPAFQRQIIKPGRESGDLNPLARFLVLLSVLLIVTAACVNFAKMLHTGW